MASFKRRLLRGRSMTQGPLEGLRVLDLTNDTGRFATKLLAEAGADVIRIGSGTAGPAMVDPAARQIGGVADWWYDNSKRRAEVDLDTDEGRSTYIRLATSCDLLVETEAPGRLSALGIDHADLASTNPGLVQVSLTPFGRTGPRAHWQTSDLVAGALGGVMSLTGLPELPLNSWGRQTYNVAGFVAAISGLAALRASRRSGCGELVDVSLHEAVCTTVEQLLFQYWFDDVLPYPKVAERQGSLHWIRAYKVVPARRGWAMVTPTPNAPGLLAWMAQEGFPAAVELAKRPLAELIGDLDTVMAVVGDFATTKDAGDLFKEAQSRHIAFAEVQSVSQVATNPQHEYRGFFRDTDWGGPKVTIPGPVAHFSRTPAPTPRPPEDLAEVFQEESFLERRAPYLVNVASGNGSPPIEVGKPLAGLRILDLSHVLAGPMCTRILGDLGADVIKVQTQQRATTVNDPSHPYFYEWNRSKRAVTLNMSHERAPGVMRKLIGSADVLIENFSAGVLDRWGLSYGQAAQWNPRLVYVTMSGCGHSGPWSKLVTYAPTIHALCGLTYLTNPPGRGDIGPGFSLNDHAAGLSAAFAVLGALEERERSGLGQHVDISQMETGGYLIGPALIDYLNNDREAEPAGNGDWFTPMAPNDCYPTADGSWLAVTCRDDDDWGRLLDATGLQADPSLLSAAERVTRTAEVDELVGGWVATVPAETAERTLQEGGVPAGRLQNAGDLMADPQLEERTMWRRFEHPTFGQRPYDRFPALFGRSNLEPYRRPAAYPGEDNFEVYPELLEIDEVEVAEAMSDGLFS